MSQPIDIRRKASRASAGRLVAVFLAAVSCTTSSRPARYVEGDRILVSQTLPAIRVRVPHGFAFVGKIDFKIRDVAAGERYIFAEASESRISRLVIAQFEGFLPTSAATYNYSFNDPLILGDHRFVQNTFAFSNREAAAENPEGEAALTARLLRDRGLSFEDEWMTSRFVTVPDEERRHELILFYVENVSASGHRLTDLAPEGQPAPIWDEIARGLTERSLGVLEFLD